MTKLKTPKHSLTFSALGTHWSVESLSPNRFSVGLRKKILATVRQFESDYSRFNENSLIGKLNKSKTLSNPPGELIEILQQSITFYQATDKLFNITVGAKLEQLGYGLQQQAQAEISTNLDADISISASHIKLSETTVLDLGGIGKGWLIDKLAQLLISNGSPHFIINGGGDLAVRSKQSEKIYIEHPSDPTLAIGEIMITKGSLAGSSSVKRTWSTKNGGTAHHIINPLSRQPSSQAAAVHVYAEKTVNADVLATVLLIADRAKVAELAQNFGISYLLIYENGGYYKSPYFPATLYA